MKRGAHWLAEGVEKLAALQESQGVAPIFDVVIVGSGYGGAVAAQRLSTLAREVGNGQTADGKPRALKVCVLERGLEYPPGTFPDSLSDLVGHQRFSGAAPIGGQSLPEGLMDWHVGGDVWALVGNGLGGGSLINAGVCEPAADDVLDRDAWPEPWRGNTSRWNGLYERASAALGAEAWAGRGAPKQAAMERLARETGGTCRPVNLTIASPGNSGGATALLPVATQPCISCGDCFTGCNQNSKRTLSHTYLARAYQQGAELYCGATVRSVAPASASSQVPDGPHHRWTVHYVLTDPSLLPAQKGTFSIRAEHVILAAGTFGSTEILMRSRGPGFEVSGRLGEGFSANGDVLSAFYDTDQTVKSSPKECEAPNARHVGPTITSQIEWPKEPRGGGTREVMQDLGAPGALGWLFREVVTTMMVPQRWTKWDLRTRRAADPDRFAVDEAAIARTLLTVSYADDGAMGRLEPAPGWGGALRDGSVVVRWEKPANSQWFRSADAALATRTPRGSYLLRNPLTQFMPKANYLGIGQTSSRLMSVHPLGGCRMAESADKGVVDAFGRVYDAGVDLADRGDPNTEQLRRKHEQRVAHALHDGLHVLDGSIVPTSLGINPLLTIAALAEGAIDFWVKDYGWTRAVPGVRTLPSLPTFTRLQVAPTPTTVRFGERMRGPMGFGGRLVPSESGPHVSMRVKFDPITDVGAFLEKPEKRVGLSAEFSVTQPPVDDLIAPHRRDEDLAVPVELRGTVEWMVEEPSCLGQRLWRTAVNYFANRRQADLASDEAARKSGKLPRTLPRGELFRAATHFGGVRLLSYKFEPLAADWVITLPGKEPPLVLPAGTVLHGAKRFGYVQTDSANPESANPWHQLTTFDLKASTKHGNDIDLASLELDQMSMLDRYNMPLAIVDQSNMLTGMRDLGSLAMYFARVMFGQHMLSFRRPDYPHEDRGRRELRRLPPSAYEPGRGYDSLAITSFPVWVTASRTGERIQLRLTRLHRALRSGEKPGEPVLLLHGFGSGGIQFTHPAIAAPMAPWLAHEKHFDVWVGELRTSIGLSTAARQWVMDDVALEDVPALVKEVRERTGRPQIHVVAHCIGSAMFCMAALGGRLQAGGESMIASALLMQVGPYTVLPRSSRARGYVAMRIQQLMGADKVSSVASQDPTDMESTLDRILATFLYPRDQRPYYRLTSDHAENVRRTNANRSAGIFGQLFQRQNMSEEVLDVMEDLLGDCNLTTYAQTAQYAFGGRLTDQRGDDAYVTDHRIRAFFKFPVGFLHGEENQTFHRRTHRENLRLAERMKLNHRSYPIKGFGHLDCIVGKDAAAKVFVSVVDHLEWVAVATESQPVAQGTPAARPRLPCVGPWIGDARFDDQKNLSLRVGLRIDELGSSLNEVFGAAHQDGWPATLYTPESLSAEPIVPVFHESTFVFNVDGTALDAFLSQCSARDLSAPLELLLGAAHEAPAPDGESFARHIRERYERLQKDAVRRGVPNVTCPGLSLDVEWLRRVREKSPSDLGLVLGACRQRPLLVDRDMADRSMRHVLEHLDRLEVGDDKHCPVDAIVLAGDQVYADSRVDATHPGSSGGRFFDAYREAWTAPWQREVFRRRPVYMVVDDHEFRNDYNNKIAESRPHEYIMSRQAASYYQIAAGPPRMHAGDPWADWRSVSVRGFELFLTDTRADRSDDERISRVNARIMRPRQMKEMQEWLRTLQDSKTYGERAKIVVMASPIAPLVAGPDGGLSPLHGDGWQRFPESMADLLGFIAENEIKNVVFLSGDYHRFVRCELKLQAPGKNPVTATSIVTGGLYAPYPFANADSSEWLVPKPLSLFLKMPNATEVRWSYAIVEEAAGDGYVRLTFSEHGAVLCHWQASPKHVELDESLAAFGADRDEQAL